MTDPTAHEAWLKERRGGIGGSDAAAILGFNPYANALDVWMDKKGLKPAGPDREVMWWGRELEGLIRRRYEETTGLKTAKPEGILHHPKHPVLLGNPDAIVMGSPRPKGLEVKTANVRMASQWGEVGTDEIPAHYLVQCCHYMLVTGYREWDVAVLLGGSDFRVYPIKGDPELLEDMGEQLLEWWQRYIVRGEEPAIDGSDASREYLQRKYPSARGELVRATDTAEEWALTLRDAKVALKLAEIDHANAENHLKDMIGDALGFQGRGWRAKWSNVKPGEKVDWEQVAVAFENLIMKMDPSAEQDLAAVRGLYTSERPGQRRFLFTVSKED